MSGSLKTTLNHFFAAFRSEIAAAGVALHHQDFDAFERVIDRVRNAKVTSLIAVQAQNSSDQFEEEVSNSLDSVTSPSSSKAKSLVKMLIGTLAVVGGIMGSATLGTLVALVLVVVGALMLFKGLRDFSGVDRMDEVFGKIMASA